MSKNKIMHKIYPSRGRAFVGFIIGLTLGILLIVNRDKIPPETPWYMYIFLCVMPGLAIIAGLKNSFFSTPIILIDKDGLAYPKIGLRKLLWQDIQETNLLSKTIKSGRHTFFSPNDSDRCLEIAIVKNSEALKQLNPLGRILLDVRKDVTVLPIALMGSKTTTAELQKIIETAQNETNNQPK